MKDAVQSEHAVKKVWRDERAQGTVEFALAAPLLFLLLIGIVDLGRAMNAYVVLANASREGARYAAIAPSASEDDVRASVVSRVTLLDASKLDVAAEHSNDGGATWTSFGSSGVPPETLSSPAVTSVPVRVTVRYPIADTTFVIGAFLTRSLVTSSTMDAKR